MELFKKMIISTFIYSASFIYILILKKELISDFAWRQIEHISLMLIFCYVNIKLIEWLTKK